jgi:flagellar hook-basal body complex protein FliE
MTDPLGLIRNVGGAALPQAGGQGPAGGPSFKDVLMKNIEQVNQLQQDAAKAIEDLASGKRDDLANVTMATKKAELAFQMLVQVQNKLVNAYEEIKQMRV